MKLSRIRFRGRWAGLVALAVFMLVSPVELRAQSLEDPSLPDNPLQGRALFESQQCNRCHRIDQPGAGPALSAGGFKGSFLQLGAALWNHVPGMSVEHERFALPWPKLSPTETMELLAFLYYIDYLGRPGVAARGEELFESNGCRGCHSLGQSQAGGEGPDLSNLDRYASPLYVAQAIWNHGPSMLESMRSRGMRPPRFVEGDLADLSAYIRRSGQTQGTTSVLLGPGNPNRGAVLFEEKGCGRCHSVPAEGERIGPDLANADLHHSAEAIAGSMWNHAVEMERSIRELGMAWPQFSTTEMADLVAFLYFQDFVDPRGDPMRGREVFVSRSCSNCHGAAETAHPGPDLSEANTRHTAVELVAAMWNHAPVMKEAILEAGQPWPLLSGEDLRDLLAFLDEDR